MLEGAECIKTNCNKKSTNIIKTHMHTHTGIETGTVDVQTDTEQAYIETTS